MQINSSIRCFFLRLGKSRLKKKSQCPNIQLYLYIVVFYLIFFVERRSGFQSYGLLPFEHNHNPSNNDNDIILREQRQLIIFQNAVSHLVLFIWNR